MAKTRDAAPGMRHEVINGSEKHKPLPRLVDFNKSNLVCLGNSLLYGSDHLVERSHKHARLTCSSQGREQTRRIGVQKYTPILERGGD